MPGSIFEQLVDQSRTQGFSFSHPLERERGGKNKDPKNEVAFRRFLCLLILLLFF